MAWRTHSDSKKCRGSEEFISQPDAAVILHRDDRTEYCDVDLQSSTDDAFEVSDVFCRKKQGLIDTPVWSFPGSAGIPCS